MANEGAKNPFDAIIEAARMIAADEVQGAIENATMTNVMMLLALHEHKVIGDEVIHTFIASLEEQSKNAKRAGLPDPYKNTITAVRIALQSGMKRQ